MSIKEAEQETLRIYALCDKGIHPRAYEKGEENKKQSITIERQKQL